MKRFFLLLVGFCAALIIGLGIGVLTPHPSHWRAAPTGNCVKRTVFIISNGVHTDIAFQLEDLSELRILSLIVPENKQFSSDALIAFGWGERIFYTEVKEWKDLTLHKAAQALFSSPGTLMHVSIYAPHIAAAKFGVCQDQWEALLTSIEASFVIGSDPLSQRIDGYGPHDWFFPAVGSYSPFYTCNSWTVSQLRRAGIQTPLLGQFPGPLLWHLPYE